MSSAEGLVVPKPGIPKTLGILNIIFGVILVLFGICGIGMTVLAPALMDMGDGLIKKTQADVEARNKATEKQFDDQIAAAKTDEEKKALEQQKAATIAMQPRVQPVDMSAAKEVLKDPTIMGVTYAGAFSGLILHIMLLVSGIGLIRLAPWARSLAVWWGGLVILYLAIFLAANIAIVMPANKPITDKQIANLEEQAKGKPPGSPEEMTLKVTKLGVSLALPLAVGQTIGLMIYPIVVLILLNTKGARAACLGQKPESFNSI
jgi:hypothetical protein